MSRPNNILDIWTIQNHYPDDQTKHNRLITPHTHRWEAGPPGLKDTWDAEVVEELKGYTTDDKAELVTKHRFSAFLDTRLDTLLRMKGITVQLRRNNSTIGRFKRYPNLAGEMNLFHRLG